MSDDTPTAPANTPGSAPMPAASGGAPEARRAKATTKQLAIRGVMFNWIARLVSIVIVIFLTPFLARTLGTEVYGLWTVVMGLTNFYALADLGLRGAGTKYIAQYSAVDDRESVSRVMVTCMAIYALLALIPLVASVLFAMIFPVLFPKVVADVETQVSLLTIQTVVVITGVQLAVRIFGAVFGAALVGQTRFDESSSLAMAHEIAQAIFYVYVLRAGYGVLGLAAVALVMGTATQVVQAGLALRSLPGVSLSPRHFDRTMMGRLFSFSVFNVVVNSCHRLHSFAGALIVGAFAGATPAAGYAIAESLIRHAHAFTKGISNVVLPVASRFQSQQRRADLQQMFVVVPRLLLAVCLLMVTLFGVWGDDLIRLWLRQPDLTATTYPLLVVLSAAGVLSLTASSLVSMMLGMGQVRSMSVLAIFDGAMMLVLGVGMTWMWGAQGMAWAVLVTDLLASGVLVPLTAARTVHASYFGLLAQTIPHAIVANILGCLLALWLGTYYVPPSLWMLVLCMGLVSAVTAACALFTCLSSAMRVTVFGSLGIRWPLVGRSQVAGMGE